MSYMDQATFKYTCMRMQLDPGVDAHGCQCIHDIYADHTYCTYPRIESYINAFERRKRTYDMTIRYVKRLIECPKIAI